MKEGSIMKIRTSAAMILAALTLQLCACGESGGAPAAQDTPSVETEAAQADITAPEETTEAIPADNLPDADLGGAEFSILAAAEQWAEEYFVGEMTGDVVDDAVYKRNSAVEERFNVKLVYTIKNGYSAGTADISKLCTGSVMSGSGDFDLVITNSAYTGGRILENVFIDMKSMKYQDFSAPWWIKFANDNLTVGGRLYAAAGRYSLSSVKRSWAVYFNKNVQSSFSLPNFYDEVRSGKWTYDSTVGYGKQVSSDLDGNGTMDKEDRFGIIGTVTEPFWAWQIGMGRQISYYDDAGVPQLTGDDQRTCDIYEKLRAVNMDTDLYFGGDVDPFTDFVPMLAADKALFGFYTLNITANPAMRDIEQYGILPLPKLDETQENYYTHCFTDVFSVLKVVKNDFDTASLILEALNAENNRSVIPQFYEIALLRKYTRDDDSAEMLDIICAGSKIDICFVFYSSIDSDYFMPANIFKRHETFTTFWAKQGEKDIKKLQKILDTIASFE